MAARLSGLLKMVHIPWYDQVPINSKLDISGIAKSLLICGTASEYDYAYYPLYMPLPFQRTVPGEASLLKIDAGTVLKNVDFHLPVGDLKGILISVKPEDNKLPHEYKLYMNYPNPFNPVTKIKYSIPEMNLVTLQIYDILGNEIALLVNADQAAGTYDVSFDASGFSSGIYIYRLKAGKFTSTKKMILLK